MERVDDVIETQLTSIKPNLAEIEEKLRSEIEAKLLSARDKIMQNLRNTKSSAGVVDAASVPADNEQTVEEPTAV